MGGDTMSKSIAIKIDEKLKQQAETILDEIGLNMSTYVISSFKSFSKRTESTIWVKNKQHENEKYITKLNDAVND